ncbi:CDP-diacylglycerol--serine O-phosphatidyltransferase [Anoxybacter fermentans]|uniref:CDP-diacylglycerol--serine O-phosphatidyltransferase n=1 Tax=Anoxybacter fermentans TaxID=1323375 RepID=A0A3Q9HQZ8_9FIRM|nr:CDP-diacylglycerol--serine O-phosphatidyltransferase [Anoxybacter fermentans]AZR72645.1 CDP-diacylglycerol--serine O-phosphatidyltransferase [Anoxybacter fermentans]
MIHININKHWIPCTLTMTNLFLGILALLHAFQGKFNIAAFLIIIAACVDRADGKVARRFNLTSDFGKELDSLSDLISFGVAPAVIAWGLSLNELGNIGYLLTACFPISGAYRLARYNVTEFAGVFQGIPITVAGGLLSLVTLVTNRYDYHFLFYPAIILILSYLMVSKIPFQKI